MFELPGHTSRRLYNGPVPMRMHMEDPTEILPLPQDSISLDDGRVLRVVTRHHASPIERWQMWKLLSATFDGMDDVSFRKRLKLRLFAAMNVLNPNCQACTYEVVPARCPRCDIRLQPCEVCGKPSQCGELLCVKHEPDDGSWGSHD